MRYYVILVSPRCGILIILHDDVIWWYYDFIRWWDVMRTRWWLRSTAGSYGWPEIEAAYREIIIHSIEAVWKILVREEWLGCRYDTSPMVDIPRSTPVWAQYMVFFDFTNIKVYMYYDLKIYSIMKETLKVSNVVLTRRCSKNIFDCSWCI